MPTICGYYDDGQDAPIVVKEKGHRGSPKMTEADIIQIRALAKEETYAVVGSKFGISAVTVAQIVHRKTWKHVA